MKPGQVKILFRFFLKWCIDLSRFLVHTLDMGKRSNFERKPRDYYPTPLKAVIPLIPHLDQRLYIEPCAGDGSLIKHLNSFGVICTWACDIEPQRHTISKGDALKLNPDMECQQIITNTPWERKILHAMIEHFRQMAPAWLLLDADWAHTKQAIPYMEYCAKMVAVGRVKWIPDSKHTGKENVCWYKFVDTKVDTIFVPQSIIIKTA